MYSPFWQNDKNTIILYNVKRKMLQKTGSRFGLRWCDKSYYKPLKNYCRFWAVRKKYTSEMRSDEGSGDDDSSRLSKVEFFWRFWGLYQNLHALCVVSDIFLQNVILIPKILLVWDWHCLFLYKLYLGHLEDQRGPQVNSLIFHPPCHWKAGGEEWFSAAGGWGSWPLT